MRYVQVSNSSRSIHPLIVKNCDTFLSRLQGLMFVTHLPSDRGILLDEKRDSRVNTSIHMLFMNFDITAVWINSQNIVVDVKVAKRWALAYAPVKPARFILEASILRQQDFQVGDKVNFTNVE